MFGALHVLRKEPTYATALTETDGVAYTLVREFYSSVVERSAKGSATSITSHVCGDTRQCTYEVTVSCLLMQSFLALLLALV